MEHVPRLHGLWGGIVRKLHVSDARARDNLSRQSSNEPRNIFATVYLPPSPHTRARASGQARTREGLVDGLTFDELQKQD